MLASSGDDTDVILLPLSSALLFRLRLIRNQIRPATRPTPTSVTPTAMPAVAPVDMPPLPPLLVEVGDGVVSDAVTVTAAVDDCDDKVPRFEAIVSSTVLV